MKNGINRGDIYYANLDPSLGSEQDGIRPVLIVQNSLGNRHSPTTIVAPITSKQKAFLPTHLAVIDHEGIESGAVILLEQIRTIDKSRIGKFIGKLDSNLLNQVSQGLSVSLGIRPPHSEASLEMTLCNRCADAYRDTKEYKLRRIEQGQQIKEPCILCTRPGYDYELTRKK